MIPDPAAVPEGQDAPERPRAGVPAGFPELPPIPAGRYTCEDFQQLERQGIWRKSWLYACHAEQVPEPGSFLAWDRTGSPIVIVRTNGGEVRAFYNSCRHRGGPLVQEPSGTLQGGFVCTFHGWSYDLEGRLRAVPDKANFTGLDTACLGLRTVRCGTLGNWVFLNEDPEAPPLTEALSPVAGHLQSWAVEHNRYVATRSFLVQCNFKLLLENFFEVYHLGAVHARTVNRFLDHRRSRNFLWPGGHSMMLTPHRDAGWVDPGARGLPEFPAATDLLRQNNVSYNLFPNLVTPVAPSGLPFLVAWPLGVGSAQLDVHWFAPPGSEPLDELWSQRLDNFDRILGEDRTIVEHQQRSAACEGFDGTRVGYQERRIYH